MFVAPSDDQVEADANANRAVSDVERRPVVPAKRKVEKIHNVATPETVHNIAGNATGNQADRDLITKQMNLKRPIKETDDDQRDNRDAGEDQIGVLEHAPRRAGISPVDQPKKTVHYRYR